MHKVACVKMYPECYECGPLMEHITKWSEIDDETFKLLSQASKEFGFVVVELLEDESHITKSVQDYVELTKKRKAQRAIDEAERLEKKRLRDARKKERNDIEKDKQIEALRAKLALLESN